MNNRKIFTKLTIISLLLITIHFLNSSIKQVSADLLSDTYIYLPFVMREEPAPPPPSPGIQILPNYSYYVDSIDYLHIVGEILNNTSDHLEFVRITANFFNISGQLVANEYTYTDLWYLPAWEKTCFHILLEEPSGWSYYQFESPSYRTGGQPLPNLTVLNDSGSYDPYWGWYEIIGLVRNDHGSRVDYVMPVGTVYNASGIVVGCDFTFVNNTDLDAGQTSSFTLNFSGRDYSDVTSYRIQVDGNP